MGKENPEGNHYDRVGDSLVMVIDYYNYNYNYYHYRINIYLHYILFILPHQ